MVTSKMLKDLKGVSSFRLSIWLHEQSWIWLDKVCWISV